MAPYDMAETVPAFAGGVHLDTAHQGDIKGAFGSIKRHDVGARDSWKKRLLTLLAIVGPGLIVMVGDNDAGAFGTYAQAGQNYGTSLLWTLMLLVPVLYVNQEMVVRLGVVTGVGHARLIFQRFGRCWGAFSIIDLFLLNALTSSPNSSASPWVCNISACRRSGAWSRRRWSPLPPPPPAASAASSGS